MLNQKGFSLVEVMTVVVILGSLVTLLSKNVTNSLDKSKYSEGKIKVSLIKDALNMYYSDCGFYPEGLNALVEADEICDSWGPKAYVEQKQLKDPWKHEFIYERFSNGYKIVFLGKDGKEGGKDYAADFEDGGD